jgi:hypothetical protein
MSGSNYKTGPGPQIPPPPPSPVTGTSSRRDGTTQTPYISPSEDSSVSETYTATCSKSVSQGRAMAQAVSRRPPTAEARVRSQVSPWNLWWTKWHWDKVFSEFFGFPLSISFYRCSITRKRTKNNHHLHLHHRVGQEASRLQCVRKKMSVSPWQGPRIRR